MKSLAEMTKEVDEFCHDKGWRGNITFGERMALLHSEISEALEAYRDWGLEDKTEGAEFFPGGKPGAKPEGVGSEFADILIRLLDDAAVVGADLDAEVEKFRGVYAIPVTFGDQMNALHGHVHFLFLAYEDGDMQGGWFGDVPGAMAKVYVYLAQLAQYHNINLWDEYERKMAYNRTRPYRHGGKKL